MTVIEELFAVLKERQANPSPESYTAQLLADEEEIMKKIGEEAIEVILAAAVQGRQRLIEESADLVYHLSVLLVAKEVDWADVEAELVSRR